jgi:RHS repeat-associated protein
VPGLQPFSRLGNTALWAGVHRDPHTGWDWMGARVYLPALRQFLSRDPAGYAVSTDEWAYTPGDPWNFVDRTGWSPESAGNASQGGSQRMRVSRREGRRLRRTHDDRLASWEEEQQRQREEWAAAPAFIPLGEPFRAGHEVDSDGLVWHYYNEHTTVDVVTRRGDPIRPEVLFDRVEVRSPQSLEQIVGRSEFTRLVQFAREHGANSAEMAYEVMETLASVLDHAALLSENPLFGAPDVGIRANLFEENMDNGATLLYTTGCWSTVRAVGLAMRDLGIDGEVFTHGSPDPMTGEPGSDHAGFRFAAVGILWDGDLVTDPRSRTVRGSAPESFSVAASQNMRIVPSENVSLIREVRLVP